MADKEQEKKKRFCKLVDKINDTEALLEKYWTKLEKLSKEM